MSSTKNSVKLSTYQNRRKFEEIAVLVDKSDADPEAEKEFVTKWKEFNKENGYDVDDKLSTKEMKDAFGEQYKFFTNSALHLQSFADYMKKD